MIPRAWGVVISQYLLSVTNETLIRAHGIVYFNTKTGNYYRVTNLLVGLTWILTVPLSARFCLGWWEFGRRGWARWWNIPNQSQRNPSSTGDGSPCTCPADYIITSKVILYNIHLLGNCGLSGCILNSADLVVITEAERASCFAPFQ